MLKPLKPLWFHAKLMTSRWVFVLHASACGAAVLHASAYGATIDDDARWAVAFRVSALGAARRMCFMFQPVELPCFVLQSPVPSRMTS